MDDSVERLRQKGDVLWKTVLKDRTLNAGGKFEWVDSVLIKVIKLIWPSRANPRLHLIFLSVPPKRTLVARGQREPVQLCRFRPTERPLRTTRRLDHRRKRRRQRRKNDGNQAPSRLQALPRHGPQKRGDIQVSVHLSISSRYLQIPFAGP